MADAPPGFTEADRVSLLAREWEYRHQAFWTAFNIWGFVVGAAIVGPFLNKGLVEIGWPILIVPAYGTCIALFAGYHLGAEARRMSLVFNAYAHHRRTAPWKFNTVDGKFKHRLHSLSSGKVISNLFFYVLAPACISSGILLSVLLADRFGNPFSIRSAADIARGIAFVAAWSLPLIGFLLGVSRTLRAESRKHLATPAHPEDETR